MLTVLGEAERFGAVFANGAEVVEVISENGQGRRRRLRRRLERRAVRGPRRQRRQRDRGLGRPHPAGGDPRPRRRSRGSRPAAAPTSPSPRTCCPWAAAACIVPAGEERTIFALPWYGRALVGTTDRDYEGDIARVQPSGDDIEYLLDAANSFFGTELGRGDLTGAYAGVRPLISTGDPRKSVDISRRAELYETSSGLLTITGGKLTTWRRMAKQVVDRMVEREGREAPCHTAEIPLGMPADDEDLDAAGGAGGGGPPRRMARPAGLPLRARRAPVLAARRRAPRAGARRSSRATPTCSPRRRSRRGSSRRARSPTSSCAGRASGCWPRPSSAPPTPWRRSPSAMAGELGWDARRVRPREGAEAVAPDDRRLDGAERRSQRGSGR